VGFRDLIINIFTSGKAASYGKFKEQKAQTLASDDNLIEYVLLNFIHIFGSIVLLFFAFRDLSVKLYIESIACFIMALVGITGILVSRTKVPEVIPAAITMIFYGILCVLLVWGGNNHGGKYLFVFIYPMLTVILLGRAKGIVFSAVLLVIVIIEFSVPGFSRFDYDFDLLIRMCAVYVLISGMTLAFETSRKAKDRVNKNLTKEIIGINENLQNIVEERTQRIVKLQTSILKTMANLVESRDSVTGGHIERTQHGVNLLLMK
jgi:hypothetical protein